MQKRFLHSLRSVEMTRENDKSEIIIIFVDYNCNRRILTMKRLIAALFTACALMGSAQAQNQDFEQILQNAHEKTYKPILESAHPEADSLAFLKVRARMDSIRQYRPTVGLVLAGGGARGLAHRA